MSRPVQSFKKYPIEVAIWGGENGNYQLTINKSYKDKNSPTGEYKTTNYFFDNESLIIPYLINRANAWIDTQKLQNKPVNQGQQQQQQQQQQQRPSPQQQQQQRPAQQQGFIEDPWADGQTQQVNQDVNDNSIPF